jgi:uncharacterized secreted protein with C-terminal beta-propeller domain
MSRRLLLCAVLAATIPVAGCTSPPAPQPLPDSPRPAPHLRLVAFDSCQELITDLRRAARANVGPYGFPGSGARPEAFAAGGDTRRTMGNESITAQQSDAGAAKSYSGTNNHEQGADEPDIVKTDGRRIVTVDGGVLRVVDTATRTETGKLDLDLPQSGQLELLLAGDSALVLVPSGYSVGHRWDQRLGLPDGPQLVLVDLSGAPRLVSRYRGEGSVLDARLIGGTARVVLRSTPRITFPDLPNVSNDRKRIATNQKEIDRAPGEAWLPGWEVTTGTRKSTGRVGCDRVSRPTEYSGTSLVSVLTFDLTRPGLGSGDPVTVVADGDTVYATANSLYLANDKRWQWDWFQKERNARPPRQETDLYKFTIQGAQPPAYVASGTVPGYLINQYALSEWDGRLRVATTDERTERSAVRVLTEQDGKLVQSGVVDGLGKGERIYSVRFLGARGYVVTFKQTDPLYSLDLSDPAAPKVTGELKITGYSAHLQPAGENRLIGIGQEASEQGRVQGTQISLFDVADPANPKRLAQYHLKDANSEAEYDPHALLWWPATNLLVVPVFVPTREGSDSVALTLRVDDKITLTHRVRQPPAGTYPGMIQRSLVVGDVLWTLSDTGLQASQLSTMERLAWLPL